MTKDEALELSLIHWLDNQCVFEGLIAMRVKGLTSFYRGASSSSDDCTLCNTFSIPWGNCSKGCPLYNYLCCAPNSVYGHADSALRNEPDYRNRRAVANMVELLASILPSYSS
jgi:hypothetical protein